MNRTIAFAAVMTAAIAASGAASSLAAAAELPAATKAILKEIKMPETMLDGIDEELAVPADWLEKANKEGKVIVSSSWDNPQFVKIVKPFQERYPKIKLELLEGSFNTRVIKTLVSWKLGSPNTDILGEFGGAYSQLDDLGALEDLTDLPGFQSSVDIGRDPNGKWVGMQLRYWCMSYNTNLVKKDELPKTWDDLLTDARWQGGQIAIGNRPQLWILMLWGAKGPEWTTNYMKSFFEKVQPQLRKEGMDALVGLNIAGEFKAVIPAAEYRVKQNLIKGAPISWHCPEPMPLSVSEMGILKGSPHLYAAKMFVNWFVSKEGQVAQFYADHSPPVHKGLQDDRFVAFPEELAGKQIAERSPQLEGVMGPVLEVWNPLWEKYSGNAGAGGPKP
jgi:iron(III) transport system substrate-binding protein